MLPYRLNHKFSGTGFATGIINQFNRLVWRGRSQEEAYLHACLEHCDDLSTNSIELQEKIKDWSSKYHLSPDRANLLRCLDLDGIESVLELGSGCGPITRYLGEKGMTVHAVESCPVRSTLTRMRCRDLDNVHVINEVYHDLSLPLSRYDVIFMIGVLDHPSFHSPKGRRSHETLKSLVRKVKKSLRPGGILVATVEKQKGLESRASDLQTKGNSPVPDDVIPKRTISFCDKQEWKNVFMNEGDETCAFVYPFPDYRFPRVLLRDDFIASDIHSSSLLYRVLPENRVRNLGGEAHGFWQRESMHESRELAQVPDSYLMLISSRMLSIKHIAPFDFVHFSSEGRRLEYRTCTFKLQGVGRVSKRLLCPGYQFSKDRGTKVRINELESNYERGPLVVTLWREACLTMDVKEFERRFTRLLLDYYVYVQQEAEIRMDNSALVDLLPSNLVAIAGQTQYRAIDQEWIYAASFSTDFILFRALLWFGYHNRCTLAAYRRAKSWDTVRDFVAYCFACLSLPLETKINEFVALEDGFHAEIALSGPSFSTWGLLEATL